MWRNLFFIIFGPPLVQAAPFTLSVSCNGSGNQVNTNSSIPLICRTGGHFAESVADPSSLSITALAEKDLSLPGIDQAITTIAGIYTIVPADPAARFFNPCLSASFGGLF